MLSSKIAEPKEQKLAAAGHPLGHLIRRGCLRVKPTERKAEMGNGERQRPVDTLELLDSAIPE